MSAQTIPLSYANSLIFELEKAFWDERGKGARFRTTTIGRQYFEARCQACLQCDNVNDIVPAIERVLVEDELASSFTSQPDDRLIRLHVEGCVHRPVEEHMLACGVKPFTCMLANLLVLAVETGLNRPMELAEIKLGPTGCDLLLVLMDKRLELAQPSAQPATAAA